MKRERQFAEMGRERELKAIQDAMYLATDVITEFEMAAIQGRPADVGTREVYAVMAKLWNHMRPYIKKTMPEEYKELEDIQKYIVQPNTIETTEEFMCGEPKTIKREKSPFIENISFPKLLEYFYRLQDDYIKMDWGAPTPKIDDVYTFGEDDYEPVEEI